MRTARSGFTRACSKQIGTERIPRRLRLCENGKSTGRIRRRVARRVPIHPRCDRTGGGGRRVGGTRPTEVALENAETRDGVTDRHDRRRRDGVSERGRKRNREPKTRFSSPTPTRRSPNSSATSVATVGRSRRRETPKTTSNAPSAETSIRRSRPNRTTVRISDSGSLVGTAACP